MSVEVRQRTVLVTGGMGFIGANFILHMLKQDGWRVINLDRLSYAANRANLTALETDDRHIFVRGDLADRSMVAGLLATHRPSVIVNFAAETHVDRSILKPAEFVDANVLGTFNLLDETLAFWRDSSAAERASFRFLHISTDEVYGSLTLDDQPFDEDDRTKPNSPYAASKAAADHLIRAYHQTYGLPTLITRCCNNYGPRQHPEKLIPLMILKALQREPLPLYGDGLHVRDWLYVEDHCVALQAVIDRGRPGHTYNVGGGNEHSNIQVVKMVCSLLDELVPSGAGSYVGLIAHVADRPGHDRRYAMKSDKVKREVGWQSHETFATGIRKTVAWYLANGDQVGEASERDGHYKQWLDLNYARR